MRLQAKASCFSVGLFALVWLLAPRVTPGQIATTVDIQGKTVYINADPPRSRARSVSTSSGTAKAAGASTTVQMAQTNIAKQPQVAPVGAFLGRSAASSQANPALDQVINDAAYRHRVDPALVKAVINTESGWNARAISRKGALGLMQLIPSTAERFGVANAFDPAQNIEGGTTYLRALLDRYNGDLTKSLAAYNAGEHIVDLKNGVPGYRETQRYVQKVTKTYFQSDNGRDDTLLNPLRPKVRQEVDSSGRVVFTNE
jgi:soluble lytic murein transglycosylase-like protein